MRRTTIVGILAVLPMIACTVAGTPDSDGAASTPRDDSIIPGSINSPTVVPAETQTPDAGSTSEDVAGSLVTAATEQFGCLAGTQLSLGFTAWRSPSLNLEGLNDLYVVPIDLENLAAAERSESDGFPGVLVMKGLQPIDYEACRQTFSEDLRERIVDWSPNGDTVLVYESNGECRGDGCPPFRSDLYALDIKTNQTVEIASLQNSYLADLGILGLRAAFSPDGDRVAYIDGDFDGGGRRIVVTDLVTKNSQSLVASDNDAAILNSIQWSPDGASILLARECHYAVVEDKGRCSGIWSIDARAQGSGSFSPQQLHAIGEGKEPVWSPDGSRIAFTNIEGVWVSDVDGIARELVAPWCAGWACGRARWSPDGESLVIKYDSDNHRTTGAYGDEVWAIKADGSDKWRVSPLLIEVSGPAQWSPDGEWIAYGGCSRWGCNPYVTQFDGSETVLIPSLAPVESGSVVTWRP